MTAVSRAGAHHPPDPLSSRGRPRGAASLETTSGGAASVRLFTDCRLAAVQRVSQGPPWAHPEDRPLPGCAAVQLPLALHVRVCVRVRV